MRIAHKNGDKNLSGNVRQTFYHAYLPCGDVNLPTIEEIKLARNIGRHPPDFPKSHATIEQNTYQLQPLSELGNLIYGETHWTETSLAENQPTINLTPEQISFFRRYGFIFIPGCIPHSLIDSLNAEIHEKLLTIAGINSRNLLVSTPDQWSKVCGSFGGMLEFYFLRFQERIREHPNPYWVTVQLLENTWFAENNVEMGFYHPFLEMNPKQLWLYVDRMNFRLPEEIADKIEKHDIL